MSGAAVGLDPCSWCWGAHVDSACPYSLEEARAIRKARKVKWAQERRSASSEGRDSGSRVDPPSDARDSHTLRGGVSITAALSGAARRLRGHPPLLGRLLMPKQPGRPRKHRTDKLARSAAAYAYRQRRRLKVLNGLESESSSPAALGSGQSAR